MQENKNLDETIPSYDSTKTPFFTQEVIKKFLPHREPFLFVDEILEISLIGHEKNEISAGSYIVGVKKVEDSKDFPVFKGHFPSEPVFPGVLLLECMAQIGGILILHKTQGNYSTYLTGIDKVKFKNKVKPKDVLVFKIKLEKQRSMGVGKMVIMSGKGYVEKKCVVEAEIKAQIIKNSMYS